MSTITITFGNQAENHVGMQKVGHEVDEGYSIDELKVIKRRLKRKGYDVKLKLLKIRQVEEEAGILIIRNAIGRITSTNRVERELRALQPDTQYWCNRRKQVLNKQARYNLIFGDVAQDANYAQGKGTIIDFDSLQYVNKIRRKLPRLFGEKARDLLGEANYYYDVTKCGIGFHGDTERRIVIAFRVGEPMPLQYQWFKDGEPIGKRFEFIIGHGDMYVMSDKAVGYDWKRRAIPTLRHATGCDKYLKIKGE